jgi:hypothetical protein
MKISEKTKKNRPIKYWLEVAALGIVLGLILQGARAWTEPGSTPPTVNVGAPLNTSNVGQIKEGNLVLGGLGVTGISLLSGDVGIGTTAPQAKLDVSGLTLVGDVCLFADRTKCLSNTGDPDSGWREAIGLDNWPDYVICTWEPISGRNDWYRLELNAITRNASWAGGQANAIFSNYLQVYTLYVGYKMNGERNPGTVIAGVSCPANLHLDGRKYECVSGITCPSE